MSTLTGEELVQSYDMIDATQNLDSYASVSGIVKNCAVNLSKMSNDLRLMSSGPRTGFGEINLPARQNGSSIMPGKINPVIPEVVNQVAFNIIGNDVTITMAAEAGQLELNAFEPIIFYNLFESIETLTYAVKTLVDNCITGITANKEHCRRRVENSIGVITAICPYVGYETAANIAKGAAYRPPGQRPDPGEGSDGRGTVKHRSGSVHHDRAGHSWKKIRWSSCGVNEKRAYRNTIWTINQEHQSISRTGVLCSDMV